MTANTNSRYGVNNKAERVHLVGNDFSNASGGSYRLGLKSGLLTLIAAQTSTAGHMAAFRFSSSTKKCLVNRIYCRWWTTTGFTSAQEIGMGLVMARSYTASHTGGTAATITTGNGKKNTDYLTLSDIDFRIGDTAALTAGTHTLDAQNFADNGSQELADGASVVKKTFELEYNPPVGAGPIVLSQNEGFVLRNHILGGAAGVWRVSIGVDFDIVNDTGVFIP